MKNYRLQLASNYQVLEFNLCLDDEDVLSADHPDVVEAVEFINSIGKIIEQDTKVSKAKKTSSRPGRKKTSSQGSGEMASERQLDFLEGLGYDGEDGWDLTKEQANKKIRELQSK